MARQINVTIGGASSKFTAFGAWTGFDQFPLPPGGESYDTRVARVSNLFGGRLASQRYFQLNTFTNWPQYYVVNKVAIVSFDQDPVAIAAGTFDSQITTWLSGMNPPSSGVTFYVSCLHEPDIGTPVDPTQFINAFRHLSALVLQAVADGQTNLKRAPIYTNFELVHPDPPNGWLNWYPGDAYCDAIGFDCYWNSDGRSTAQQCYGAAYQACVDHNKEFIVPETGYKQPYNDSTVLTDAQWATNTQAAVNYLTGKAKAVCWFESNKADGDWRLAPHTDACAIWRDAVINSY